MRNTTYRGLIDPMPLEFVFRTSSAVLSYFLLHFQPWRLLLYFALFFCHLHFPLPHFRPSSHSGRPSLYPFCHEANAGTWPSRHAISRLDGEYWLSTSYRKSPVDRRCCCQRQSTTEHSTVARSLAAWQRKWTTDAPTDRLKRVTRGTPITAVHNWRTMWSSFRGCETPHSCKSSVLAAAWSPILDNLRYHHHFAS